MKTRLASMLRCPLTGDGLSLQVLESTHHPLTLKDRQECERRGLDPASLETCIKTGVLYNERIGVFYPIVNYVPLLLDFPHPLHTRFQQEFGAKLPVMKGLHPPTGKPRPGECLVQEAFTKEWNVLRDDELTFNLTHQEREDYIRLELDWPGNAAELGRGQVLDVGCGYGLEGVFLRNVTQGEVFAADLNFSLLNSGPMFADKPFVHTVIASLYALPFAKKSFDVVYTNGVLHHTYSTKAAFNAIYPFKADDGMIYIWVYAAEDVGTTIGWRVSWLFESLVRPKIARLPAFLQNWVVHLFAWRHYREMKRCGHNNDQWKFKNSVHFCRDRWTPLFAHRELFQDVQCWFLEKGLTCKLVNPLAFKDRFGFPMIGIGLRGMARNGVAMQIAA